MLKVSLSTKPTSGEGLRHWGLIWRIWQTTHVSGSLPNSSARLTTQHGCSFRPFDAGALLTSFFGHLRPRWQEFSNQQVAFAESRRQIPLPGFAVRFCGYRNIDCCCRSGSFRTFLSQARLSNSMHVCCTCALFVSSAGVLGVLSWK